MADPTTALFWGEDEFLLRDAARSLLESREMRATEVEGSEWQGGETFDLATPSLWGEGRALLIVDCQSLPEAGLRELSAYLAAPSPDALCVMTLVSGARTAPALAKVVQAAHGLVKQIALRRQELPGWLVDRARQAGIKLTGPGAAALVDTLGEDAASLQQGVEQLRTAFAGQTVGPEQVRSQFQGLGEQRVWDLCDLAFSGRVAEALVVLRGLLEAREDPLLILGGIASRVRDLLKVRALPDRMPAAQAAKAAGLRYDWQLRRYREQAGRFSPAELAAVHRAVAESDRLLKGGVGGEVVLLGLVAAMAGEPAAFLDVPVRVSR